MNNTAYNYWKAAMSRKLKQKKNYSQTWQMPRQSVIKLNFYAAFTDEIATIAGRAEDERVLPVSVRVYSHL